MLEKEAESRVQHSGRRRSGPRWAARLRLVVAWAAIPTYGSFFLLSVAIERTQPGRWAHQPAPRRAMHHSPVAGKHPIGSPGLSRSSTSPRRTGSSRSAAGTASRSRWSASVSTVADHRGRPLGEDDRGAPGSGTRPIRTGRASSPPPRGSGPRKEIYDKVFAVHVAALERPGARDRPPAPGGERLALPVQPGARMEGPAGRRAVRRRAQRDARERPVHRRANAGRGGRRGSSPASSRDPLNDQAAVARDTSSTDLARFAGVPWANHGAASVDR